MKKAKPDVEIDAEFYEPQPVNLKDHFDEILELIDTLESNWRDSGIDQLADPAAKLGDAMRQYRRENDQFIPRQKPQIKE